MELTGGSDEQRKNLSNLAALMFLLNLVVILYYSIICLATTLRICNSFGAYEFLTAVQRVPRYPWQMPVWALSQYLLLCAVSFGKSRWEIDRLEPRLFLCVVEIMLCIGITVSLDFYYSGVALLVLADLVHYVRNSIYRLCFRACLTSLNTPAGGSFAAMLR